MIQSNVSADFTFFCFQLIPIQKYPQIPREEIHDFDWSSWLMIMTSSYRALGAQSGRSLANHTYTYVGWRRLSDLIGRFPEKPRNYPKRNFNRWKPFSYEFVIAADSHIQTFIEVKTSGSTSGRKIYFRLETNRENPLPVGVSKWKLYRLLQCFYCI